MKTLKLPKNIIIREHYTNEIKRRRFLNDKQLDIHLVIVKFKLVHMIKIYDVINYANTHVLKAKVLLLKTMTKTVNYQPACIRQER